MKKVKSDRGNYGDESAIEETDHEKLFGIPIETHPNYDAKKNGWFKRLSMG